uniref:Cell division protein ZapB n=1 Tax=candidate division WOR-3 bacterium TaxID=2052148 RepID=A0A7V3ZVU9_UNCW3
MNEIEKRLKILEESIEKILHENKSLKEENDILKKELAHYQEKIEKSLKKVKFLIEKLKSFGKLKI